MPLDTLRQCDLHENCVVIFPINISGCPVCKLESCAKKLSVIESIIDRKDDEE